MHPSRFLVVVTWWLATTAAEATPQGSFSTEIVISVRDQLMTVRTGNQRPSEFSISTSKFGVGDTPGSYRTPLGVFRVERKVGHNARSGAVFKGLESTGEIVSPNAPGRDPIVTRVLCLRGVESRNGNARSRGIFIHGTPEETRIGHPASYGCIRMRSRDVIALYDTVSIGTRVTITDAPGARAAPSDPGDRGDVWFR